MGVKIKTNIRHKKGLYMGQFADAVCRLTIHIYMGHVARFESQWCLYNMFTITVKLFVPVHLTELDVSGSCAHLFIGRSFIVRQFAAQVEPPEPVAAVCFSVLVLLPALCFLIDEVLHGHGVSRCEVPPLCFALFNNAD